MGINTGGQGVIQAVVFATSSFNVADVDLNTVRLGDASVLDAKFHDENSDGDLDLILHFRISDTGLAPGDTQICLSGQTVDGRLFQGCDVIRILG